MNLIGENITYKPDDQFHLNDVSFNFRKFEPNIGPWAQAPKVGFRGPSRAHCQAGFRRKNRKTIMLSLVLPGRM